MYVMAMYYMYGVTHEVDYLVLTELFELRRCRGLVQLTRGNDFLHPCPKVASLG